MMARKWLDQSAGKKTYGYVGLAMVMGWVGGCEKPLFPADLPRTPYERYQQLHGDQRAVTEENAYGGQQPALRHRLRPLDQH